MVITLIPAAPGDVDYVIDLKATVLRADLERAVGAWSPSRSAQRVRDHFSPAWTRIVRDDDERVGTITMRPEGGAVWLEMFYLEPVAQGRGIGSAVLEIVLAEVADRDVQLQVLDGSRARPLYERHGFVLVSADGVDDILVRSARPADAGQPHGGETVHARAGVLD
ncbi:GNAT family N-acetyltransferase [Microbacterium nymphoidis]|uniref:GNAT family N-acetyltransferase n=1 Tax=Microbacterium nymphoidis TaxID=2898586 RepID=UPI001E4A5EE7|nr:GNAT family N-acetyltransferase [Microbacterium nymphoidis]MCD2499884.1 GNAT family N-acetyltransferase [Microbacterium nymphoidis]